MQIKTVNVQIKGVFIKNKKKTNKKTLMFWGCPLLLDILRNTFLRSLQKTATINK